MALVGPNLPVLSDSIYSGLEPPLELGTPAKYMAPEVIAGAPPSTASDVWSLGCAIFRLRTGRDIFFAYDFDSPLNALDENFRFLGDIPDSMARTRYDEYGWPTKDESGMLFNI